MTSPKDRIVFENAYEIAEYIGRVIAHDEAYKHTCERLNDAHEYVQKYCMPEGWGINVWHTILDDAIRLRNEKK